MEQIKFSDILTKWRTIAFSVRLESLEVIKLWPSLLVGKGHSYFVTCGRNRKRSFVLIGQRSIIRTNFILTIEHFAEFSQSFGMQIRCCIHVW